MRIAYLSASGQLGGAEICLLDCIAVLRQARPDWEIAVVLAEDGPLRSRCEALGTRVQVLSFPSRIAALGDSGSAGVWRAGVALAASAPAVIRYRGKLADVLEQISPEIIHSNGLKTHVLGALAKPARSKLVWHQHDYLGSRPVMAHLLRRLRGGADMVITNSESVAQDFRRVLGAALPVRTILNVVDLQEFSPSGERLDLDQLSGLSGAQAGTIRVGLVATMAWWKGHRLFLKAIAKLNLSLPVRGYVIGGAVYQTGSRQESIEGLKAFADALGIRNRVGFTGFVASPAEAIRALDVVVHASTEPEPFGRVIVEAMACAKPLITSGLGGAAEIVTNERDALLFDPRNPDDLARAIERLAMNSQLREYLGGNGLSTARDFFDRERLASQLPSVYEEVTHSSRSSHAAMP